MEATFYIAAGVAVLSTILVVTRLNAVHALMYLIVSFMSVSLMFFTLGAPFVAALEVIVYAGAIMVLFVFVVMLLNLGPQAVEHEREWFHPRMLWGPGALCGMLLVLVLDIMLRGAPLAAGHRSIEPKEVSLALYGPYVAGVELASMLLMAALVGAYYLARRDAPPALPKEPRA